MSEFAKNLRDLRLSKSLTQGELAKKLGVSISRISMYERGQREPNLETLEKLASVLNTTPAALLGWSEEEYSIADKYGFTSFLNMNGYSHKSMPDQEPDAIGRIINIMLDLDNDGQEQLIKYGEFLLSQKG